MAKGVQAGSSNKIKSSLVALSSAAVLAVYSAGYVRTRGAADQWEAHSPKRNQAPKEPRMAATGSQEFPLPSASSEVRVTPEARLESHRSEANSRVPAPRETTGDKPNRSEPSSPSAIARSASDMPAPESQTASTPTASAADSRSAAPTSDSRAEKPPAHTATAAPMWKDGTYRGWGTSRHGDIQAEVRVEGGRIVVAKISECDTKYSCNVIEALPPEVAQRQSVELDHVSGATESADAFCAAVVEALSKAK